ncbi:unnamed protein product [Mytilus coruscus]|uniref:Uncharacterized protein n=1 Tax=Mytilus coruscus TaxID=42192 RepID=A0A6J8E871_MYTCO|nr:unnamed protein product [Mytilus coruscus]
MKRSDLSITRRTHIAQKLSTDFEDQLTKFQSFVINLRKKHHYNISQIGNADEKPQTLDMPYIVQQLNKKDKKDFHIPSACALAIVSALHDIHGYLINAVYPIEKFCFTPIHWGKQIQELRDIDGNGELRICEGNRGFDELCRGRSETNPAVFLAQDRQTVTAYEEDSLSQQQLTFAYIRGTL